MTANLGQIIDFELQPILENELIKLQPLKIDDFQTLYEIASDPLIWEQHPDKERYKREVFDRFFIGAIESNGAFLVFDSKTGKPIGSSRYYDLNKETRSVEIGFTFLARDYWGTAYNRALKSLMLEYAFKFVNTVILKCGANNIRSQKAIEKLGANKIGEGESSVYYSGEKILSFIYQINKENWIQNHKE